MRLTNFYLFLFGFLLHSCGNADSGNSQADETTLRNSARESKKLETGFQNILDSADLKGTILLLHDSENTFYSNDFQWCETGFLPASTYKIPNSIIALETGVVESDSTLFKWDGQPKWLKVWEQDLVFKDAFKYSCVHCYQQVARDIGEEQMNDYLRKLDYGAMEVDSSTVDQFWLRGESRISPFEQVDFLKRFYDSELPISQRTESTVKNIMLLKNEASYKLYGKTGWSVDGENNNGWFVGFVEKEGEVFFYATDVEPKGEFDQAKFLKGRKRVILEALRLKEFID